MTSEVNAAAKYSVEHDSKTDLSKLGERLETYGKDAVRYTVAGVLGWIGLMKFTAYEAGAIEGLVASSPLTSWLYSILSLQGAANLIGSIEIVTALLIVVGIRFPKAAVAGAVGAIVTFIVTLSFMLSAPGWEASLGGFPALSVVPGQFLLKDTVLLAASFWMLGEGLRRLNSNT